MGTKFFSLHPDDRDELIAVRHQLVKLRLEMGLGPRELSAQTGRGPDFINRAERDLGVKSAPLYSTLQVWAAGVNARVEPQLDNFWLFPQTDPEFLQLFRQSRPFLALPQVRLLLVAMLRQWRMHNRLDLAVVAPLMADMAPLALGDWELESHDPLLSRAMFYARALGTRLRLPVFTRSQWRFE